MRHEKKNSEGNPGPLRLRDARARRRGGRTEPDDGHVQRKERAAVDHGGRGHVRDGRRRPLDGRVLRRHEPREAREGLRARGRRLRTCRDGRRPHARLARRAARRRARRPGRHRHDREASRRLASVEPRVREPLAALDAHDDGLSAPQPRDARRRGRRAAAIERPRRADLQEAHRPAEALPPRLPRLLPDDRRVLPRHGRTLLRPRRPRGPHQEHPRGRRAERLLRDDGRKRRRARKGRRGPALPRGARAAQGRLVEPRAALPRLRAQAEMGRARPHQGHPRLPPPPLRDPALDQHPRLPRRGVQRPHACQGDLPRLRHGPPLAPLAAFGPRRELPRILPRPARHEGMHRVLPIHRRGADALRERTPLVGPHERLHPRRTLRRPAAERHALRGEVRTPHRAARRDVPHVRAVAEGGADLHRTHPRRAGCEVNLHRPDR